MTPEEHAAMLPDLTQWQILNIFQAANIKASRLSIATEQIIDGEFWVISQHGTGKVIPVGRVVEEKSKIIIED